MTWVGNIIYPSSECNNVENEMQIKPNTNINSQYLSKERNINEKKPGRESIESSPNHAPSGKVQTISEDKKIANAINNRTRHYSVDEVYENENSNNVVRKAMRSRRDSRKRSHSLPTGSKLSKDFFQGTLTPACEKLASDALYDTEDVPKYRGWNEPTVKEGVTGRVVCVDIPQEIFINKMPKITENEQQWEI